MTAGSLALVATLAAAGGLAAAQADGHHMSSTMVVVALAASAVLILLNGLFVAYEFAVVAARRSAFEEEQAGNGPVARAARASLSDLSMQLAGAQLGITIASLTLARVGEPALETLIEPVLGGRVSAEAGRAISYGIALAVFTFLHLVFGEMVPKNIALTVPERTLRWSVLPYRLYLVLFRPVVSLLNAIANGLARLVGIEPRDEILSVHTASELSAIVHRSQQGGAIEPDNAELLQGALDFAQRPVADIATPVSDQVSVVLGTTATQLERLVASTGVRRILVRSTERGQAIGYFHARDLLEIPAERRSAPVPAGLVRKATVVRSDDSLIEVLRILRRVRRQLAVVETPSGEPGVVSVEEVVRALVEPATDRDGTAPGGVAGEEEPRSPDRADPLDVLGQVLSADS